MAKKKKRSPFALGAAPLNQNLALSSTRLSSKPTIPSPTSSSDDNDSGPFDELIGAGKVVLDVLSAPQRALGGIALKAKEDGFQPTDLVTGLKYTFDEKADPSNVLGIDNFWGALAADVLLDPLAVAGVVKAPAVLAKGGKALKEGASVTEALKAGNKAKARDILTRRQDEIGEDLDIQIAKRNTAQKKAQRLEKKLAGRKPITEAKRREYEKQLASRKADNEQATARIREINKITNPEYQKSLVDQGDEIARNIESKQEELDQALAGTVASAVASSGKAKDLTTAGGKTQEQIAEEIRFAQQRIADEKGIADDVAPSVNVINQREVAAAKAGEELAAIENEALQTAMDTFVKISDDYAASGKTLSSATKDLKKKERAITKQEDVVKATKKSPKENKAALATLNKLKKEKTALENTIREAKKARKSQRESMRAADNARQAAQGTSGSASDVLSYMNRFEEIDPKTAAASDTRKLNQYPKSLAAKRTKAQNLSDQVAPDKILAFRQARANADKIRTEELNPLRRLFNQVDPKKPSTQNKTKRAGVIEKEGLKAGKAIAKRLGINPASIKSIDDLRPLYFGLTGKVAADSAQAGDLANNLSRVGRLEDEIAKLEDKAADITRQQLTPEEIAQFQQESAYLLDKIGRNTRGAERLNSILDPEVATLTRELAKLQEEVTQNNDSVQRIEELLRLLDDEDVVEMAAKDNRLAELIDGPNMREIGSDVVQRRLVLRFFGMKIPGVPGDFGIPLGRAYSKADRKARFAKKYPQLSKLRDAVGEVFDPVYNIAPQLAELEKGRSNLAIKSAERAVAIANKFAKKIDDDTRRAVSRLLMKADDLQLDLAFAETRAEARAGGDLATAQADLEAARRAGEGLSVEEAKAVLKSATDARDNLVEARTRLSQAEESGKGIDEARKAVARAEQIQKRQLPIGEAKTRLNNARRSNRAIEEAQKGVDQAAEVNAKHLELLDEFDQLPEAAQEAVEHVLQNYRALGKLGEALGFIENRRVAYSSMLRKMKDETEPIVMRSQEDRLLKEQGLTQKRSGVEIEEAPDFLDTYAMYQGQFAQMQQGYGMMNSLANELGMKFADEAAAEAANFVRPTNLVAAKWLPEGVYIPEDIAASLSKLSDVYGSPRLMGKFMRKWSILNGQFKNLAYSVNPGHFAIDSIGDSWNMFLAQVPLFNPKYSGNALRVVKEIEQYEKALLKGVTPKKTTTRLADGKEYDLEDIILMLEAKGLRNRGRSAGRTSAFDNPGDEYLFDRKPGIIRRGARKAGDKAQDAGNLRDNTFRTYGLITQLQKNMDDGMDFALALNSAGGTIRFSTFDYNDLTAIEKRVFRNVMPFYTWTRKNIPYQLNRLQEAPGRVMLPFNVQEALMEREDAPDLSLVQPFTRNTNFFLPDSISGAIPGLGGADMFVNPMIPSMDLGRFQTFRIDGEEGPIPGFEATELPGMLSPYIKAPFEIAMGREFFSGREIGSNPSYIMRTFLGQPGSQVVRLGSPNTSGYDQIDLGPISLRRNQIFGLTGQFLGLRGTTIEEGPASAARAARLQAIQMRKAEREEARQAAGNLFSLPLVGIDVPNPFRY